MTGIILDQVCKTYGSRRRPVKALDNFCLAIEQHQRWGIVGESGSGKTTLLKIIAGLTQPTTGEVSFLGRRLDFSDKEVMATLRSSVQMVFQDPQSSLNPSMRICDIIAEPLRSPLVKGRPGVPTNYSARVAQVLEAVDLPQSAAKRYPHEFSGGQRQRIALARSLAPSPKILLADEPVSALDVSVRAHVLNLLNALVKSMGLTLIMVTHDLMVVRHTCNYVGVMKNGRLIESGTTTDIMINPSQQYTKELLLAIPRLPQSSV